MVLSCFRINVRIEHVQHSKCREDFLKRVQSNAIRLKNAKKTGRTISLKRKVSNQVVWSFLRMIHSDTYLRTYLNHVFIFEFWIALLSYFSLKHRNPVTLWKDKNRLYWRRFPTSLSPNRYLVNKYFLKIIGLFVHISNILSWWLIILSFRGLSDHWWSKFSWWVFTLNGWKPILKSPF